MPRKEPSARTKKRSGRLQVGAATTAQTITFIQTKFSAIYRVFNLARVGNLKLSISNPASEPEISPQCSMDIHLPADATVSVLVDKDKTAELVYDCLSGGSDVRNGAFKAKASGSIKIGTAIEGHYRFYNTGKRPFEIRLNGTAESPVDLIQPATSRDYVLNQPTALTVVATQKADGAYQKIDTTTNRSGIFQVAGPESQAGVTIIDIPASAAGYASRRFRILNSGEEMFTVKITSKADGSILSTFNVRMNQSMDFDLPLNVKVTVTGGSREISGVYDLLEIAGG